MGSGLADVPLEEGRATPLVQGGAGPRGEDAEVRPLEIVLLHHQRLAEENTGIR